MKTEIFPFIVVMKEIVNLYDSLDRGVPGHSKDTIIISTANEERLQKIEELFNSLRSMLSGAVERKEE